MKKVLEAIDVRSEAGARDTAIIHTVYALALRAAELCGLDLAHLDVARGTVSVLGKGQPRKSAPQGAGRGRGGHFPVSPAPRAISRTAVSDARESRETP